MKQPVVTDSELHQAVNIQTHSVRLIMQGNEHEPSETPTESGLARSQSSLHASAAHLSDEDDKGERSAREQLKKASLVNKATQPLSNDLLRPQKAVDDLTTVASSASGSGSSVESSAANIAVPAVENGLQGETDTKANLSSRQGTAGVNDIIVDEEDVTAVDMENDTPGRGSTSVIDKSKTQAVKPSHEQLHDRREGGSSPRKKRSRDQLDNDVDREQKIVATEEARAQRLSSEGDRKDLEKHHSQSAHVTEQTSKQPRTVFGSVNTVSEASKGPEAPKPFGSSPQRPASPSAFASSGFAALASSSASPFGAFAPADSSSSPFSSRNTAPAGHMGQKLKRESVLSSQNQLLQSTSSDSNPVAAFAGATQKAATGSVFGGSLFNRGFNGSFGTGQKLTSFAAPNGDARLGGESRVKPIGSLKEVDPAEQSADSEAEEAEEIGKDEPSLDEDERFHSQDGR